MKCKYCENIFKKTFNNQVYCSKQCSEKMTKIKKRLRQKKYHNTLKERKCNLCGDMFRFHGMKKNCKKCVELLKEKPHLYRSKKKKI